jgi:hypothetical protein
MISRKTLLVLLLLSASIVAGCAINQRAPVSDDWPLFTTPTREQWMEEHKAEEGWYWPRRPTLFMN